MARILVIDTHPVQYKAPLYRRLQEQHGHDVTVLYASDYSSRPYQDEEFGVELAWDQDLLSGYRALFESRASEQELPTVHCRGLARALARTRPEVILLGTYTGRFAREAIAQLAVLPLPWVFRAETTDHAISRSGPRALLRDLSLRAFYARCSAFAYIGQRSLAHYRRLGVSPDKLFFSPYAVETGPFQLTDADRARLREPTRAELGIAPDRIALLFSGKLSPRKDPVRIIEAARLLPAALRDRITVLYLGAGELEGELRRVADLAPAIDIRLIGFKNQGELSNYYHAADAAVLGSLRGETWGLVMNEALHHGLPCIASDQVGSTPDLVVEGETGFPFEAGNTASLARAIEGVAPMVGTERCRERTRAHAERYTLDAAAEGLAAAIASVR